MIRWCQVRQRGIWKSNISSEIWLQVSAGSEPKAARPTAGRPLSVWQSDRKKSEQNGLI